MSYTLQAALVESLEQYSGFTATGYLPASNTDSNTGSGYLW